MITVGDERRGADTLSKKYIILNKYYRRFRECISDFRLWLTFPLKRIDDKNVFYFVFDPSLHHPGIADRIKAIVSAYNIAKSSGYSFKLYFEKPIRLFNYLKPKFNMAFNIEELKYSKIDTIIFKEKYSEKLIILKKNKQYLCNRFEGHNMPKLFPNTGRKWCDVFHEMFEPSELLQTAYSKLGIPSGTYVSCHLRFANALEKFERFYDNELPTQEAKELLIKRCKKGIMEIIEKNKNLNVYVFSDSSYFLDSIKSMPVCVLDYSNVRHIGEDIDEDAALKSFVDLYVMSQGKAVYRFCAPEIYSCSHYALLAATIGDIPFYDQSV